ncbi:MAG: hypothetical protein VYD90_10755 [Pseudomonadota bacterium]|nr:hypothetical protein [Pseudomonadota bacterium]
MKPLAQTLEQIGRNEITYELSDGKRVTLNVHEARGATEEEIRAAYGIDEPTEPMPVIQGGRVVGTVPASFHPMGFEPRSAMYDVRPGDFIEKDGAWIAANALGLGDLLAVPGFIPVEGSPA